MRKNFIFTAFLCCILLMLNSCGIGKKIKDMSKAEKAEYYRLSKQEQRLRDK